ncbi:mycofactocin system FadH/OYE family oxidoreductase 1 [Pseudonocardia sp.]|jgi:mycofactocin system FadH/OYE family oxidoreductase 1|uniref:mycofactocin system FadH/OYE family oxidoreductase 1 n=1 Tax=Pseudonocardia sp. TaxID=60912 RepID=UPI0031FD5E25
MSLLDAISLRGRRASARVLFGPHETNLAYRREISARHVRYYARRAAGGCGVIVTEIASVHPSDWPYERAPLASDCGPGWAEVVRACRPHGSLVLAGLGHSGAQGSTAFSQQALWGPSRVLDVVSREVPQVMEAPEVDALVAGFAAAASVAVGADLDGVEINAGQHSLLRQFLSGLTNHRRDAFGADRGLLLRSVVAAVRAELGAVRVLGLRVCVDELAPWAGITPASALDVLRELDVDYVVPVRGSGLTVSATRPDLHTPPGFNRELSAAVRSAVAMPVVLQGSVVDPAMATAALTDGTCDLVEMTRAQITDPDLVAHARAGTPERIRPCTLSNQDAARDPRNPLISAPSPEAGTSSGPEDTSPDTAGAPGATPSPGDGAAGGLWDVLVVGGGPAGLEAARSAALQGHRVRLVERSAQLGGALRWAAAVHGRARMGVLIPWWERELARLGVEVSLGVEVGLDDLDAAEAVVLATGSVPSPPAFASAPSVRVLPAAEFEAEVLAGRSGLAAGADVVVHDPIGDWTGVGIAEQVAAAGVACSLVTPDAVAGTQLGRTGDLADANARLERAGVRREVFSRLRSVTGGVATIEDVHTGETRGIPGTLVIDCAHRLPEDTLWRARPDLVRVGDCVAPRTVAEAVLEGRRAGEVVRGGRRPGNDFRAEAAKPR